MSGMTGDYRSMAEVDGQYVDPVSPGWVPGVDFNPDDDDDMELMRHVWGRERADRTARLERENETLRAALRAATGEDC